jgi:hypothetical protein
LDAGAEGLGDGEDVPGLLPLDGDGLGCEPPPDPLPEPLPEPLPPVDGEEVGLEEGDDVGDEVGEDVGEGEVVAWTGGVTPGGAALPLPCFHAHPTEPPAGTVREPELYDE